MMNAMMRKTRMKMVIAAVLIASFMTGAGVYAGTYLQQLTATINVKVLPAPVPSLYFRDNTDTVNTTVVQGRQSIALFTVYNRSEQAKTATVQYAVTPPEYAAQGIHVSGPASVTVPAKGQATIGVQVRADINCTCQSAYTIKLILGYEETDAT